MRTLLSTLCLMHVKAFAPCTLHFDNTAHKFVRSPNTNLKNPKLGWFDYFENINQNFRHSNSHWVEIGILDHRFISLINLIWDKIDYHRYLWPKIYVLTSVWSPLRDQDFSPLEMPSPTPTSSFHLFITHFTFTW